MFFVEVDWSYGVDRRIVEVVDFIILDQNISEDRIKVISETEIIILNNPL